MSYMFNQCSSLSILNDISKWNINNTRNMNFIFCNCLNLSKMPDISKWNLKDVKDKSNML